MNSSLIRWGTAALVALAMAGCGGGDSSGAPPPGTSVAAALAAAAAVPANDTAINSSASFTVVQDAGVPAVTVTGAPKVNFSVFSDGKVVSSIPIGSVSFAIAKLVPGTNGNPDQWVNYIYRAESTAKAPNNVGSAAGGLPVLATALQATTDSKMSTTTLASLGLTSQLVYNPDGYYTYVFSTNIMDPTKTNSVAFERNRTHRVAIQLAYKNAAGATVLANPYFDFTVGADGKSVTVTDPAQTRKMTDVSSCNGCHEKLALHGGGRVDTQYCVMCHNPGTTDANSGNVLNLATMVHKIHSGKLLYSQLATGGEEYTIWGYNSTKYDYAEVGFPQDLRNCAKCHSASNAATPQGDNWKKVVSKEACLTCHANNAGSAWDTSHKVFAQSAEVTGTVNPAAQAKDLTNTQCATCHVGGLSSERVHWNQNEENAAKYKMNIESVTYSGSTPGATSTVTVQYYLSDPTNSNAAYDLQTSDNGTACTGSGATLACSSSTKFGNLRFYLAYQNMIGQSKAVTEWSANNNGGSGANAYAYKGTNIGGNHYTVAISVPPDTTYTAAFGTARVVSIGQVKEKQLQVKSATDPRPPVVPTVLINTVVQNTYKDVALTGALQPRREIVSSAKCNVCHGALGTTSGSNTLASAFHSGARDTVEACSVCHDANKVSSTVMTSGIVDAGVGLNESYQMKRMIHGIHTNSKRTYPYTHGNVVVGAFDKTGKLTTAGSFLADQKLTIGGVSTVVITAGTPVPVGTTFDGIAKMIDDAGRAKGYTGAAVAPAENYAAEVAYPQVGVNCDSCHVNGSWKQDLGTLGAVVSKAGGNTSDPNTWKVISPKAASCTACHDSSAAQGHVVSFGGARFGSATQTAIAGLPRETCDDCHAPGNVKGVDLVHGQK